MKSHTKVFAIAFCALILIVFGLGVIDFVSSNFMPFYIISVDTEEVDAMYSSSWDGSEDYPFEDETTSDGEESILNQVITLAKNAINLAKTFKDEITESNPLYYTSVYVNKFFDKMCGYDISTSTSGAVVELEDGYMGQTLSEDSIESDGLENVESLVNFGLSMVEDDRNFLYVFLPCKIELSDYSGAISKVYETYNQEMDQIAMDALLEAGLDVLDMAEAMEEDGMADVTAFYKTDHHWRGTTGLYACSVLGEALNELYGYEIDTSTFDEENYTITILEDQWIGSLGWKVTTIYEDFEDFEVIIPNYETELEVYLSKTNTTYYGTIDETLYAWSYLTGEYNVLAYNPYMIYGYGNLALVSIHNNLVNDGSSVLIIKDSYANSTYPFFATEVENLYVVDLRIFVGCLDNLIKDLDPDTVVVMYNNSELVSENAWDHTDLFDFR